MTRVYTLQDVLDQLHDDASVFIDTSPNEPVNQFLQSLETVIGKPAWSDTSYTPYPWLVANQDGPTGFWLLGDPAGATFVFDSSPYVGKSQGTPTAVTFGQASQIAGATSGNFNGTSSTIDTGFTCPAATSFSFECCFK